MIKNDLWDIETKESVLEKLNDDSFYYGKGGAEYLSASTLKKYLKGNCLPEEKKYRSEEAMIFGNMVHKALLEPEKYEAEKDTLDDETQQHVDFLMDNLLDNDIVKQIMNYKDLIVEKPYIGEWGGVKIKGKIDIELPKATWDLKTTSKLDSYDYTSENVFGYPLSAYQYYLLTGKIQHYIIVEKNTGRVRIKFSDKGFYTKGRNQWMLAMRNYKKSLQMHWLYLDKITDKPDGRYDVDGVQMNIKDGEVWAWVLNHDIK